MQPVNSVRAEEIPAEVGLRVASGWLVGIGIFETDRGASAVNDRQKANFGYLAQGIGAFAMDGRVADGEFFTRESYDNCLEQAFTLAAGATLIDIYDADFGVPLNTGEGGLGDEKLIESSWAASAAGADACRTALIRTGRVFDLGVLRF